MYTSYKYTIAQIFSKNGFFFSKKEKKKKGVSGLRCTNLFFFEELNLND